MQPLAKPQLTRVGRWMLFEIALISHIAKAAITRSDYLEIFSWLPRERLRPTCSLAVARISAAILWPTFPCQRPHHTSNIPQTTLSHLSSAGSVPQVELLKVILAFCRGRAMEMKINMQIELEILHGSRDKFGDRTRDTPWK